MLSLAGIIAPDTEATLIAWQTYMKSERRYADGTQKQRAEVLEIFLRFLQEHYGHSIALKDLASVTLADFRAWVAALTYRGLSTNTRAYHVAGVRMFYRWLEDRGILSCSAIDQLQTPKRTKSLPRALTLDESIQLIDNGTTLADDNATAARDTLLLVLLYATGLRISEMLSLNIDDVRGKTEVIVTGKGHKQRLVPLLPTAQKALAAYLPYHSQPSSDAPLFLGARGDRLRASAVQKRLRDLRHILGLPEHLTPHALRHTFATHLLAGGADLRTLQELLGHASLSSTQIYTAVETDQLIDTFRKAHPKGR